MNKTPIFPQEVEEGNIEYKRKIDFSNNSSQDKFIKFKTQLLWRLDEGKKQTGIEEATYYIGIDDDGTVSGEPIESIEKSISNFNKVISSCNVDIHSTQIKNTSDGVYAILNINRLGKNKLFDDDIKIALLGASNNGKTTFLGILTYDLLDDGNGLARENIFRHSHEKQNGTTSSIKYEIVGYNDHKYLNYNSGYIGSWEYIVKNSKRLINFIDLPGNSKYLKTTLFGLMAHKPDYVLIFVSLENICGDNHNQINIDDDTKLYINLCIKLNLPFAIIFTKKDKVYQELINKLIDSFCNEMNLHNNSIPFLFESLEDIEKIKSNLNIIPMFTLSNITGENIDLIKELLKSINLKNNLIENKYTSTSTNKEFMINDIFFVPDVGIVISGILNNGIITINDKLLIGPINQTFYNIEIKSIHKKQLPSKILYEGEIGSLVIKVDNKLNINKHLMLITAENLSNLRNKFKIRVKKENYIDLKEELQLMIFCQNIYDSVIIEKISNNDQEIIIDVKFSNDNLQYIKNNNSLIIRYNNQIIVGNILI